MSALCVFPAPKVWGAWLLPHNTWIPTAISFLGLLFLPISPSSSHPASDPTLPSRFNSHIVSSLPSSSTCYKTHSVLLVLIFEVFVSSATHALMTRDHLTYCLSDPMAPNQYKVLSTVWFYKKNINKKWKPCRRNGEPFLNCLIHTHGVTSVW